MKNIKIGKKEYTLKIDFLAVKSVRARVIRDNGEPFDLMNLIEFKAGETDTALLSELAHNSILLLDVLYTLLREQLNKNSITEEDFYREMTGEELERATDALLEEVIDFFPPAKSAVLRKFYMAVTKIQQEGRAELLNALETRQLEEEIERRVRGALSASAPVSSE